MGQAVLTKLNAGTLLINCSPKRAHLNLEISHKWKVVGNVPKLMPPTVQAFHQDFGVIGNV